MPRFFFALVIFCVIAFIRQAHSERIFAATQYGARGDGKTKNTKALQSAIDAANASGGGRVVLPKNSGVYLSGSLWLASHVILDIQQGATLLGSPDQDDYPEIYTRSEGTMRLKHASLINGGRCLELDDQRKGVGDWCSRWHKLKNVTITGKGTIDGQGHNWWSLHKDPIAGPSRPTLLGLVWITGLTVEQLTIMNSPFWSVHTLFCENVTLRHLLITAPSKDGHNTDGIDPDSCTNVHIHDCVIDVGDDCIAIKSGKNQNGRDVGMPTKNVLVENCRFVQGHGAVSIGSEMSGNITDVTVRNCIAQQTERVIRLKTAVGRGGVVANILWENIYAVNVGKLLDITMRYQFGEHKNSPFIPTLRNITIRNIVASAVREGAGTVACLANSPCLGLSLQNITVGFHAGAQYTWLVDQGYGKTQKIVPYLRLQADKPGLPLVAETSSTTKTKLVPTGPATTAKPPGPDTEQGRGTLALNAAANDKPHIHDTTNTSLSLAPLQNQTISLNANGKEASSPLREQTSSQAAERQTWLRHVMFSVAFILVATAIAYNWLGRRSEQGQYQPVTQNLQERSSSSSEIGQ